MLDLVNFKQKYSRSGLNCELGCNLEETQENILLSEKLEDKSLSNNKLAGYGIFHPCGRSAHKWSPTNGKDEKKKSFDEMKNYLFLST